MFLVRNVGEGGVELLIWGGGVWQDHTMCDGSWYWYHDLRLCEFGECIPGRVQGD